MRELLNADLLHLWLSGAVLSLDDGVDADVSFPVDLIALLEVNHFLGLWCSLFNERHVNLNLTQTVIAEAFKIK